MTTAAPPQTAPFDIDEAMRRVTAAVSGYPLPSMFQLAADGFATPFQQLAACVISIRTLEEVSLPSSRRLFAAAPDPATIAALPVAEIERLIAPSTFADRKAVQIRAMAETVLRDHAGELPCDGAVMQSFAGVGPKCSQLALGIACLRRGRPYRVAGRPGKPGDPAADDGTTQGRVIPVDIHVHRVTNRWDYVRTRTPEATMVALERVLPLEYDVEINRLLVPFGKHICSAVPRCPSCPLVDICPKEGVTRVRA